jgi:hypothetical protein
VPFNVVLTGADAAGALGVTVEFVPVTVPGLFRAAGVVTLDAPAVPVELADAGAADCVEPLDELWSSQAASVVAHIPIMSGIEYFLSASRIGKFSPCTVMWQLSRAEKHGTSCLHQQTRRI